MDPSKCSTTNIEKPISLDKIHQNGGKTDENNCFLLKKFILDKNQKDHNHTDAFCLNCSCQLCDSYVDVLLEIWEDQLKSQNLWNQVRGIIRNFYQSFHSKNQNNIEAYMSLVSKATDWIVNGSNNNKKTKYLELIFDLSLTDYMKLVLYSSILYEDDPQQFFELISYEFECVVRAYANGLSKKIADQQYSPKEVLTYVLNGYEEICKINKHISSFLFSFEENHLKKISCSLLLVTKRLYQYWLYSIFVGSMPECLIKLKDEIDKIECEDLIPRYIKFDEDMILTDTMWAYVWLSLDSFNNLVSEKIRKSRIISISNIFNALASNEINSKNVHICLEHLIKESLQKKWITKKQNEIKNESENIRCKGCNSSIVEHKVECNCGTCVIAGSPLISDILMHSDNLSLCSSCLLDKTKMGKSTNPIVEMNLKFSKCMSIDEDVKGYHYSWAVFKHLKDRMPYKYNEIKADLFCSNCTDISCLLAKKILANEVPMNVAQFLVENYQPFSLTNDEIAEMIPKIWLYHKKLKSSDRSSDEIGNTFWCFIVSSYASCYAQTDKEKEPSQINFDNLKTENDDIQINLSNDIGLSSKPNKLVQFIQSIIKEKNISEESHKAEMDQITKLDNSPSVQKCCNSESSETNGCKKANPNKKVCFHANECKHNRKIQTRDRLRLKLKNNKPEPNLLNDSCVDKSNSLGKQNQAISKKKLVENTTNQTMPTVAKAMVESSNQNAEKSIPPPPPPPKIKSNQTCNKSTILVSSLSEPDTNIKKWVKDTLSFIEGSAELCITGHPSADSKKAAKKAKQKQKKEESKHIEELQSLRDQFYDIYFKEFDDKSELKDLKKLKKKDKKRIQDLEQNIKKLAKAKSKIENYILERIAVAKSINNDFKFSYLPTKEQQQKYLSEKIINSSTSNNNNNNSNINSNPSLSSLSSTSSSIRDSTMQQYLKNQSMSSFISNAYAGGNYVPNPNFQIGSENLISDASKRIVTIRRVNLPNCSEPQVTVTAKGDKPDNDKLLYTFFNGHIVAASSINTQTNNKTSSNYIQMNYKNQNELNIKEELLDKLITNQFEKKKTKTQIKKEKKLRKQKKVEISADENVVKKIDTLELHNIKSKNIKTDKKSDRNQTLNVSKENKSSKIDKEEIITKSIVKKNEVERPIKNNSNLCRSTLLKNNQFNMLDEEYDENDNETCIKTALNQKVLQTEAKKLKPTRKNKGKNKEQGCSELSTRDLINKKEPNRKDQIMIDQNKKSSKSSDNLAEKRNGTKNTIKKQAYVNSAASSSINNLQSSMSQMNISDPSEISFQNKTGISIMDQLKQGIQVENLTLPPGITLTRIDPSKVEEIKAKTKTIEKLSKPMENHQSTQRLPLNYAGNSAATNDFLPHLIGHSFTGNGEEVIMVDTGGSKKIGTKSKTYQIENKATGKKNKKKKGKWQSNEISPSGSTVPGKSQSKIITLKNPMFHGGLPNMEIKNQFPVHPLINNDLPAAIMYNNENGMFTIRNSALQESIESANNANVQRQNFQTNSNSVSSTSSYMNNVYNPMCSQSASNYSNVYHSTDYGKDFQETRNKCISAIGSEIKNAQQQKIPYSRNNCWPQNVSPQSASTVNGYQQSDPISSPNMRCINNVQSEVYQNSDFNFTVGGSKDYNDVSYIDKLIMDQNLNNEVTIHSIKDAKFKPNRENLETTHKVDITPIPPSILKEHQYNGYPQAYNMTTACNNGNSNEIVFHNKGGLNYGFEESSSNFLFNSNVRQDNNHDFVNDLFYNMSNLKIDTTDSNNVKSNSNNWW